jgi:uncharacterized repeat protein (TIGR03803 family)
MERICQLSVVATLFLLATLNASPARAQTYQVFHSFGNGTDGSQPNGAIYTDSAGNIYGATHSGGTSGAGVIYQIDQNGNETILHNFDSVDGNNPLPNLSFFSGTWLFGVSALGGPQNDGTIFAQQLSPPAFKHVHNFSGSDGQDPLGTLAPTADGLSAYGVTSGGGAHNQGEVYKIDKAGDVTVIYSFTGGVGGSQPATGLSLDSDGNLYGVTSTSGNKGDGVLFRIDSAGNETVIHNFDPSTGAPPNSTPVADGMGNVYGTTSLGGTFNKGVIYGLNLSTGEYSVLHTFVGGADGMFPAGDLVKDGIGHLFGVTTLGGRSTNFGVVYRMDAAGNEIVLYALGGGGDGTYPNRLYRDPVTGTLYGTTSSGGAYGQGVLFRITP